MINEVYLRLIDAPQAIQRENRSHFFGIAARIMRMVLVDHARTSRALKRGGTTRIVPLDETAALPGRAPGVIEIDEPLGRLSKVDERKAKVIELRYFGGVTREEIAAALDMTLATVKRDLRLGEAWLRRYLASVGWGPCQTTDGIASKTCSTGLPTLRPASVLHFSSASAAAMRKLPREIESLLAADAPEGELIQSAVGQGIEQISASSDESYEPIGTRIGRYSITGLIGKGGMGIVYRAVREDDFRMQVAIKLLKRGTDTEAALRCFRVERQVLAGLQQGKVPDFALHAVLSTDRSPKRLS